MPALHGTAAIQCLTEMVQACRLCLGYLWCMRCIYITGIYLTKTELCLCCCRTSVSSFKQYFSPPINAFDKLCICHAAKCNFSLNRNHISVFFPQNVQLGIQVIFLQGVTRHMQHGQGLQARLLARLACMQAAVKQGNPHIWPSTHDPVKQQVTGDDPWHYNRTIAPEIVNICWCITR